MRNHDVARTGRWAIYKLLIFAALAMVAGRIAVVASPDGATAFHSANDRSRWCTIASLVEDGTYEIDRQIAIVDPVHRHRHPWQTIDKVQHRGDDGQLHHYSSKPPLFPTLVAGLYAGLHGVTGMTMTAHPVYVPRMLLALVNLPLLAILLWSTLSVVDRVCQSRWGKLSSAVAVCFSTMLMPFSITLSNHLPAATATALAMGIYFFAAEMLDQKPRTGIRINRGLYLVAGMSIAMAAANELPALSMTVFWMGLFFWLDRSSLVPMAAGIAIIAIGFFGTNWIAHESLRPAYAHRGNGPTLLETPKLETTKPPGLDATNPQDSQPLSQAIRARLVDDFGLSPDDPIDFSPSDEKGRWRVTTPHADFALLDKGDRWRLAQWDDWYEYPGSYWQDGKRRGVDLGEPSRWQYLFHMILGHHGIFSLTPIFLLVPIGLIRLFRFGPDDSKRFALVVLVASIVCMAFYVMRPLIDRNYGGVSACFRWLLWFAPLWLVMVSVTLDHWSHHRWGRRLAVVLLALSVASMSTALSAPWQSPWLYRYWDFLGWLAS